MPDLLEADDVRTEMLEPRDDLMAALVPTWLQQRAGVQLDYPQLLGRHDPTVGSPVADPRAG